MGNLCCMINQPRETMLSSININDLMQRNSVIEKEIEKMDHPSNCITLKLSTWNKDSYDLFDFENSNRLVQQIEVNKSIKLHRCTQNGEIVEYEKDKVEERTLLNLQFDDRCFWIHPKEKWAESSYQVWLVVKSFQERLAAQGLAVNLNDCIRFGKIEMKLRELQVGQPIEVKAEGDRDTVMSNKSSDEQCRLCLSNFETVDNPLISPCNCMGSMALIHLGCLQRWITTKYNIESQNQQVIVFFWNQMKCELCKSPFRRLIQHLGQTLDIVEKSKSQFSNYAVLDLKRTMCRTEDQSAKITYIICLDKIETFRIGRANDNHIRVCDISVSRYHAKLALINQQLFIYDNSSKFGTLLKIKKPVPLLQDLAKVQFQVGRTIFEFEPGNNFSGFLPFTVPGYHRLY